MYKSRLSRVRLEGKHKIINTPYNRKRAEKLLKDIDRTVKEISNTYKVYKKYF